MCEIIMISGGIEVNQFAYTQLILEVTFGDHGVSITPILRISLFTKNISINPLNASAALI